MQRSQTKGTPDQALLTRSVSVSLARRFQRRVGSTKYSRRVATPEKQFENIGKSVVATRREQLTTRSPALKYRARVTPTLRVEDT